MEAAFVVTTGPVAALKSYQLESRQQPLLVTAVFATLLHRLFSGAEDTKARSPLKPRAATMNNSNIPRQADPKPNPARSSFK
jgi:hypothetical protein